MTQTLPQCVDYIRILPEIVLSIFGMIIMVLDPVMDERAQPADCSASSRWWALLRRLRATLYQAQYPGPRLSGTWCKVDAFSVFFHFVVIAITLLVILSSYEYMEVQQIRAGRILRADSVRRRGHVPDVVGDGTGADLHRAGNFFDLHLHSGRIPAARGDQQRVVGEVFPAGIVCHRIFPLRRGVDVRRDRLDQHCRSSARCLRSGTMSRCWPTLGVALMFVGLGFKVAAAPFHVWTPDVYEGAPSPVVGFMSTAPKAAVFAVLLRIIFEAHAPGGSGSIWVAAALSMTIGNIGALVQTTSNACWPILPSPTPDICWWRLLPCPTNGIPAAMFYTASYAAMNVGAFAVIGHFAGAGERYVTLEDYAGLGRRSPVLAATLTIFLLSLIGIPMTGGFFAKFYVFSAALQANLVGLAIIGVINSAVGAYYYLRIIVVMYMREPRDERRWRRFRLPGRGAGDQRGRNALSGVLPGRVLEYASRSAAAFLR